jgi:hypothetical protein
MNPIHRATGPGGERVCAPCRFILWLADPDRRMPAFQGLRFSELSRTRRMGLSVAALIALSGVLVMAAPVAGWTLVLIGLGTAGVALSRATPMPIAVEHQARPSSLLRRQRGAR